MSITKGDTVRLKAGGPQMSVDVLLDDGDSANCTWFDDTRTLRRANFVVATLVKVEERKGPTRINYGIASARTRI